MADDRIDVLLTQRLNAPNAYSILLQREEAQELVVMLLSLRRENAALKTKLDEREKEAP